MPTVLITGTSTGIGRAATKFLAQRGWHVFATMRDLQKREALERALETSGVRDRVEIVALDFADPATIEAAVVRVLSRTGGTLDAVVHNAGVSVAGALEDLPLAEIRRVMETNFFGVHGNPDRNAEPDACERHLMLGQASEDLLRDLVGGVEVAIGGKDNELIAA
ncbi:unnamed protein product [marine sediment metagenome]|uniref:Short-chain dehydrogenase/reductase SDR n=1 Tax=marine sediment metagenome TaxID=412755 RepID=X0TZ02_9ZZZZ